jgi:hypothetical protein
MAREEKGEAPTWLDWSTKMAVKPVAATLSAKAGTVGLPALARLTELAIAANALKLPDIPVHAKGRQRGQPLNGIAFTVKECYFLAGVSTVHDIVSTFVPQPSVGRCCENEVFPVKRSKGGDLVIKQTKTPCALCITAFSKYANAEQCTIVVQTASATDDTTLIFSNSGSYFLQS